MRKLIVTLFIFIATVAATNAQNYKSAIGLRAGDPSGVTFKTFIKSTNALEFVAGAGYYGHNLNITGYYLWQYPTNWTPGLDWYAGPGAHLGFWNEYYQDKYSTNVIMGFDGILGLEYTLDDIPLSFALGVGPTLNLTSGPDWYYYNAGISVRFVF